ncbi:hypothetical protein ACOMHN_060426 [Nucella lapillus]
MAAVFLRRPMGYKVGVVVLEFSLLLFVVGFASPYWYHLSSSLLYIHGGLWQVCVQAVILKVCNDTLEGGPRWLAIVQALQCMSLICLILSLFYAMLVNLVQRRPKHTRLLEILASLASALGLAGTVLFISQSESLLVTLRVHGLVKKPAVQWALAVSLASSVLCLIASVLIAINNSSIPPEDPPSTVGYMDPETGAVYPMVDLTGQDVFYIPPLQMVPGSLQPVVSPCQPPSYESSVSRAAHYSTTGAMTSGQCCAGPSPAGHPQYGWNK